MNHSNPVLVFWVEEVAPSRPRDIVISEISEIIVGVE
jgi:hypothetical protein